MLRALLMLSISGTGDVESPEWVAPYYPEVARAARIEGTVPVLVRIDSSGCIEAAEALGGPAILQPGAEAAATRWTFPTRLVAQSELVYFTYAVQPASLPGAATTVRFSGDPPYELFMEAPRIGVSCHNPVVRQTVASHDSLDSATTFRITAEELSRLPIH